MSRVSRPVPVCRPEFFCVRCRGRGAGAAAGGGGGGILVLVGECFLYHH